VQQFDPRIVRVTLQIENTLKTYEDVLINISGTKYANALQNDCQIQLFNLDTQTQNYILTQTSPFTMNQVPKSIIVEAGRQSYGTTKIYEGNIVSSLLSQPPDIGVTLRCLTGNFQKGNILSRGQPSQISLFQISKQLTQDLKTSLTFQASDKLLSNYIYSGPVLNQINTVATAGGVNVFIDDSVLVVKNNNAPINNTLTIISQETGMIGIPEVTEIGVKVKFFINRDTVLGGGLRVISTKNPAATGNYVIYKLGFEISNRETPFYYIAEASRNI
jgi:hypothetical protein